MKVVRLFFVLTLCLIFGAIQGDQNFDHFRLIQIQSNSFCLIRNCSSDNLTSTFVLHGLWPVNSIEQTLEVDEKIKVLLSYYQFFLWSFDIIEFTLLFSDNILTISLYILILQRPRVDKILIKKLKNHNLTNNLSTYCKSLDTDHDDESFWSYQWHKHGKAQNKHNEVNYFQKAIELMKKADLLGALEAEVLSRVQ